MFSFGKKSAPILGIDISETAIKLLELSLRGKKYQVESYAVEQLAPNSVSEKTINDIEQVGEAVASVVRKAGAKTKSVKYTPLHWLAHWNDYRLCLWK